MSKDHDGKLNTTPMIDEEIEQALLDLMDKETPDLWNRIMDGLDAPNAPSGFDDIVGEEDDAGNVLETDSDEKVGSTFVGTAQDGAVTDVQQDDVSDGQSADNVVPFRAKEDRAEDSGYSSKSVKTSRRAMSRVWGNLIAAAVVLIIISVPVSRLILNQKKSDTAESTQAATQAATEATTAGMDAMAGGADEAYIAESEDGEEAVAEAAPEATADGNDAKAGGSMSSNALKTEGVESEAYESTTAAAAYDTEAATEASIENIEGYDTITGGTLDINDKTKNIYGITDQHYLNVRKYAGTFNKKNTILSIQNGIVDASIEARIVVRDGEYYLVDYIDVSGETESEEYSEGEIRIVNPDDAGIPQLLEVEGYTEDTRYRFSVKYPEKNNENEVEIVEILSME